MGIFDRMGRVISSNFNALLDTAEDPKKSIDLTLREMADQVKAARQEVVRSVAAEKQLRAKVAELDVEVEKWAKRAELAVKHGDDELAREALLQKKRLTAERDRADPPGAGGRSGRPRPMARADRTVPSVGPSGPLRSVSALSHRIGARCARGAAVQQPRLAPEQPRPMDRLG